VGADLILTEVLPGFVDGSGEAMRQVGEVRRDPPGSQYDPRPCYLLFMTTATQLVTADDLLRMPDDGWRYELVQGELRRMPLPGFRHGRIANRIAVSLSIHVEASDLGIVVAAETRFLLRQDPDEVRGADVAFISKARYEAARFSEEKHFPGAPDLAVEVVSPSDTYSEVEEKVLAWLRGGARLVIVVDPKKEVFFAHRPGATPEILTADATLDASPAVPGWAFRVGDAFATTS
jgi:Uma2 family endonuclease